jgi:two-component system chemotaxis sensor kinase CheA
MDPARYAALFHDESRSQLRTCARLLLDWERDPQATEPVDGLFRAVHTLKGMAATMGYGRLADGAHEVESLLAAIRDGAVPAGGGLVDALLGAVDALERGVELAAEGRDADFDLDALTGLLQRAGPGGRAVAPSRRRDDPPSVEGKGREGPPARQPASPPPDAALGRLVRVRVRPDAPMRGARALLALRRAEGLGEVREVRPPALSFERDGFDGIFTFRFLGTATPARLAAEVRLAGDIEAVEFATAEGAAAERAGQKLRARHVRVDLARLDSLTGHVAELVVARHRLAELAAQQPGGELEGLAMRIGRLVGGVQQDVIAARLTPVWQVFDRFPRAVRDLARQLGKQVEFRVEGEDIELDRAILDEIGDPIVHLLRNAVDHGIEEPAERKKAGKPEAGRLVVAASRERSNVVIRVSDDGRGIDRARVLAKAKQLGVLEGGVEALADEQLLRLLARAGFSTAERVSAVSGRGVGIDAVVERLRALGGSLEMSSERGRGTTFTLRLPLTLAIVRALLARTGDERYAVPLTYVAETVEYDALPRAELQGREAVVLRGSALPTLHLGRLVGRDGPPAPRRPGIILEVGGRRAALVVDALLGQQEIVVEAFDAPRGTPPFLSGATILPDGEPALILDAAVLV